MLTMHAYMIGWAWPRNIVRRFRWRSFLWILDNCLSNAMHIIGQSIKSPECPCVLPIFLSYHRSTFRFFSPFLFLSTSPFPFPFTFPCLFLFRFFLSFFFSFPLSLQLSFPFTSRFPFPLPSLPFFLPLSTFFLFPYPFPFSFLFLFLYPPFSHFPFSFSTSLSLPFYFHSFSPSPLPSFSPSTIVFPSSFLPFLFLFPFFHPSFSVHVRASNIWDAISPYRCQMDARLL